MKQYKVDVAFTAVDSVTLFAKDEAEAKQMTIEILALTKGLDIISGSYEVLHMEVLNEE